MRCAGLVLLFLLVQRLSNATNIKGAVAHVHPGFIENDFQLYYLSRFGVAEGKSLYVFGTVSFAEKFISLRSRMALVLLPQNLTDKLVEVSARERPASCDYVMNNVLHDSMSVGGRCLNGSKDYIRTLPCTKSSPDTCNQPPDTRVIGMNDFTYHVHEAPSTQYYYLFMLACDRNYTETCEWTETDDSTLDYDINLVNADPENNSNIDPFVYQFSFDQEGILIAQLLFSIGYLILVSAHFLMHSGLCNKPCNVSGNFCTMNRLPFLFTISLCLELVHVLLELIHYAVYASNGWGVIWFKYLGEVANQFSDWLLILVLLLIGKGWMVTTSTLRWKRITFGIWGAYVFFFTMYFIWTVLQDQVYPLSIFTDHSFQSWPGGFYLAYRLFLLVYILYEMRQVYLVENRPEKLKLYVILAFLYAIWFCYLPLIVFVVAFINPLYRYRVVTVFLLTFDYLANTGVALLFVPRWSRVLFQFDSHLNTLQERRYKSLKSFYYGSSESTGTPNVV